MTACHSSLSYYAPNNEKITYLRELFPSDPELKKTKFLEPGLKEYRFLLTELLSALEALEKGQLEKFDSLVGENACQIRAIKIALIATRHRPDILALKSKIMGLLDQIHTLLTPKQLDKHMQSSISLKQLLEEEGLDLHLTSSEMFLLQSYLLWKSTGEISGTLCKKPSIDLKKLKGSSDVSSKFIDNLVSRTRRLLAKASVEFVRNCAHSLEDLYLMRMASEEFTVLHNNHLLCTPMFWTYQIVLQTALRAGIPLVFQVQFLDKNNNNEVFDQESVLLHAISDSNGIRYEEVSYSALNTALPTCVISGVAIISKDQHSKAQWKSTISSQPLEVVLAGAADHRQYPDHSLDDQVTKLQDSGYEMFKAFAKEHGFALENPSRFFIQHVYAAILEKSNS